MEIVAARLRHYHTLPEELALYTTALCALWNIQHSRTGVRCSRYVPRDGRVGGQDSYLPPPRTRGSHATYYLPPGRKLGKEKCVVGEERRRDGSLLRRPGDGPGHRSDHAR